MQIYNTENIALRLIPRSPYSCLQALASLLRNPKMKKTNELVFNDDLILSWTGVWDFWWDLLGGNLGSNVVELHPWGGAVAFSVVLSK